MNRLNFGRLAWLSVLWLSGCTLYHPAPLATAPQWPADLQRLQVDPRTLPFPELAAHPFDPRDGLDMTEVAMLAVVNNPDLRLARDDLGVVQAQAFDAGLLPDPLFSFSPQFPETTTPGANVTAFDVGLGYDLSALVLHHSRQATGVAESRKADLALLWQEWQVVGQARLLFVRIQAEEAMQGVFDQSRRVTQQLCEQDQQAARRGDVTGPTQAMDCANLSGLLRQHTDSQRLLANNRSALNGLLGLSPTTQLTLVGETRPTLPDIPSLRAQLTDLPRRRPDLRALAAGYEAQDQRLWQAILGQFPAISAGLLKARDNNGTYYHGYAVSFNLPLFNRNRGAIAIETATRQRLHDEYQVRLQSASQEISQLLHDLEQQKALWPQVEAAWQGQQRGFVEATQAYDERLMDLPTYAAIMAAQLARTSEKNALEESLEEEQVALITLMGGEFSVRKEP